MTALPLTPASAQSARLAPAPMANPDHAQTLWAPYPSAATTSQTIVIDPFDRADVVYAYIHIYLPQSQVPMGWTGNVANCTPGHTSTAFRQATIDRVNFYRAMAGLPGNISLSGGAIADNTQAAALMFSANGVLTHYPPPGWNCYSAAGAAAAAHSSIAAGYGNNAATGTHAIDLYMDDDGQYNTMAGHRRWILYPPQVSMDSGSVPFHSPYWAANGLWVSGPFGDRPPSTIGVAWPPRGFVPWQLLPSTSHRWSFSWPGANFNYASVSMTRDGVPLAAPDIEPIANGYGDNTLVWKPQTGDVSYAKPTHDTLYQVTIRGIQGGGAPATLSYDVRVIDVYAAAPNDDIIFAAGFEF
ncbi:MAG: CAP domain-containing protein [Xanthomonadales bacterium]|nr:CAP domain-containing protein [Xanthomonadales bacterium]